MRIPVSSLLAGAVLTCCFNALANSIDTSSSSSSSSSSSPALLAAEDDLSIRDASAEAAPAADYSLDLHAHAAHSPHSKRTFYNVINALTKVHNQLITINGSLNNFTGGLLAVLQAQQFGSETTTLQTDLQNLNEETVGEGPLPGFAAKLVVAKVQKAFQAPFIDVLLNTVAHKPQFDHAVLGLAGLDGQVLSTLQSQKNATDQFGKLIVKQFSGQYKTAAKAFVSAMDAQFQQAITVFNSTS